MFKNFFINLSGAIVDLIFIIIRPIAFWALWNYGIASTGNIPKLDFVQAVSIVAIFYIFLSYVPLYGVKYEIKSTNNSTNLDERVDR